jgi:hypothetical protein
MDYLDYLPKLATHVKTWGIWLAPQGEVLPGIGIARGVRRGSDPACEAPHVTVWASTWLYYRVKKL